MKKLIRITRLKDYAKCIYESEMIIKLEIRLKWMAKSWKNEIKLSDTLEKQPGHLMI